MEKTRLSAAVLCIAMTATQAFPYIPGPPSQAAQPAWLAQLYANRTAQRAAVNYSGAVYDNYLLWSPSLHIVPQSHLYDRYLYDPVKGAVDPAKGWTVDRFLDDLDARYGGVDGVLLWGTYTNLGVDERNQYDMAFSDTPGGVAAWADVVIPAFHARGVRVGAPFNPWDEGTRPSSASDDVVLARTAAEIGLDWANGDGMACIPQEFFSSSVAAGRPLSFQPEASSSLYALSWTKNSWGEAWTGCASGCVPPVAIDKWVETRHTPAIVNRWAVDHTTDLMQAFFNGMGWVPWENVWGFWNQLSSRDAEATRRVGSMLRFLAPFLVSPAWEPHTVLASTASAASVFASRWPSPAGAAFPSNATAWTLVSTSLETNYSGPAVLVPCALRGVSYFDVYRGAALSPAPLPTGDGCALTLSVEAGGYGAVLAVADTDAIGNATLAAALARMQAMTQRALASFANSSAILPQTMTVWPRTATPAPPGMLPIPAATQWRFAVNSTTIEGRQFAVGGDVQYYFEDLPSWRHDAVIDIPDFLLDATPVTNDDYAAYLAASGYVPADAHNFLLDWAGAASPPAGWGNKPVTWITIQEAAAFCAHHGKRLPQDWEWQWAMQGTDGRRFPWGDTWDATRYPSPVVNRTRPPPPDVGSFPAGASPFGVLDGFGLVWQFTNPSEDERTRTALTRGGSYFSAASCPWYYPNFDNTGRCKEWDRNGEAAFAGTLRTHGKLMLMAPSYDRHGTVGFRCAADVS